ncbi:hypothetical protein BJ508DRAFT_415211 [Ascobolus immersus RN42]|uniref:Serine/threonine-protein kinase Tel1 n=1 Tax=Ascobolus immersus RN42 TaxID=1160509 RepID=A0A3N4I7W6_ASCIM|nr:hypothetical protein BJ508DRAFT_415211 [Ascobolus immersus RN42]
MTDQTLFSALEKIYSDKIVDRKDGLAQLKSILTHNSARLSQISDKAYHKMLDAVFNAMMKEKKAFLSKSKATMTSTVRLRLELCGQVLRAVVEQGVKHLKAKTVRAVTSHITQILEEERKDFTEQFSLEYAKALRIALEWAPHREHLAEEEWSELVRFLLQAADEGLPNDDSEDESFPRSRQTGQAARLKAETEEYIICIALLASTPNAPIISSATGIADCLLKFLSTYPTITRVHQPAYSALNSTFNTVGTNYLEGAAGLSKLILPIIQRQWIKIKQKNIREQMLISLHYALPHLRKILAKVNNEDSDGSEIKSNLDRLVEMLLEDFKGGRDRDVLVLDDLRFSRDFRPMDLEKAPLSLRNFTLRGAGQAKEEQSWMVPKVLAELMNVLDIDAAQHKLVEDPDETVYSNKRTKITNYYTDLLLDVRSAKSSEKVVALQILAFLLENRKMEANDIDELLELLISIINGDEGATADWAMIVAVSCGLQKSAKDLSLSDIWLRIWSLSIRNATVAGKSRTASHLLHAILKLELVPYTSLAPDIETMLMKADLSGPAGVFDSSLNLWRFIVHKSRLIAQTSTLTPGSSLVLWLLSKYRPEDSLDRHAMSYYARNVFSCDLLDFLLTACGLHAPMPDSYSRQAVFGEIGQAIVRMARVRKLQEYLLLEDEHKDFLADTSEDEDTDLGAWNTQAEAKLLDFFARTSTTIRDKWRTLVSGQQHGVSPEMTRNAVTFLTVGAGVLSIARKREEATKIAKTFNSFASDIKDFIRAPECGQSADAALDAIIPVIPSVSSMLAGSHPLEDLYFGHFGACITYLADGLSHKEELEEQAANGSPDGESMDIDEGMGEIRTRSDKVEGTLSEREELQLASSFVQHRTASLTLLAIFSRIANSVSSLSQESLLADIADILIGLPTERLLFSRSVILDFFTAGPEMPEKAATRLIEHIGENLLQDYQYDRFEPVLIFCANMISSLAQKWAAIGANEEFQFYCEPFYEFLIRINLENRQASYSSRIATANLLQKILTVRYDYTMASDSAPKSARTYLVELLSDRDIRVKAHVSECLPCLFDLVTVNSHFKVYEDISEFLPKDNDVPEDMAIRLHVLSKLRSESLLTRKSLVFHMFETALGEALPYASRGLTNVARTLGLESPSELLELYSGQIIYTWLNSNFVLDAIPYEVAGYRSLRRLYRKNSSEIFAQLLSRRTLEETNEFCDKVGKKFSDLARESFAKSMAYGLAEAAMRPVEKRKDKNVETLLRERFGEDDFNELLVSHQAAIVAELLNHMEQDGTSDKALAKLESYKDALEVVTQITSISYSASTFTDSLKPAWKSKGILSALEYLLRTLGYRKQQHFWTPHMLVYIIRTLLDSINAALGRVHTIGVIRNIRLVVALAGSTAHSGYPLEMIVHGLRPYIFDSLCAEDTVGIIQYLLSQGKEHVSLRPAFMAGTLISVLSTLKAFMSSSQESSVEESQFQSSQTSAHSFWKWLESFVRDYKSPKLSGEKNELLREIAQLALSFKPPGNAKLGSKEGRLLLLLIRDENSDEPLLDEVSQGMAFRLLAKGFERPHSYKDDMLLKDEDSIKFSRVILRICKKFSLGKNFLLWAGRVLGRAFASSGEVYPEWTQESFFKDREGLPISKGSINIPTSAAILDILCGLLQSDDKKVVSLAEETLIEVISAEAAYVGDSGVQNNTYTLLPRDVYTGLFWKTLPEGTEAAEVEALSLEKAADFGKLSPDKWMQQFAIAVVSNTPQDPLVKRLTKVLQNVEGLAEKLLPYIIHMFLIDVDSNEAGEEDRKELSAIVKDCVAKCTPATSQHVSILLKTVIYLRSQKRSCAERTALERDDWLDLDYLDLSKAATVCGMYKTALLFAEIHHSKSIAPMKRRESVYFQEVPSELLLEIYRNTSEPDAFYGVKRQFSFGSVMDEFEYEGNGWKSLAFRSANLESSLQLSSAVGRGNAVGLVNAANTLGFAGLSMLMLKDEGIGAATKEHQDKVFRSAWELGHWDLPCPPTAQSEPAIVYRALQAVNVNRDIRDVASIFDKPFYDVMKDALQGPNTKIGVDLSTKMRTLAILAESEEVLVSKTEKDVEEARERQENRCAWMLSAPFTKIDKLLVARQVTFGSLAKRTHLQKTMGLTEKTAKYYEALTIIGVCQITRSHDALSHSLTAAMKLSSLSQDSEHSDLQISGIARLQEAEVLWAQGEAPAAIGILKALNADKTLESQNIAVSRVKILAKLGKWIAQARFEKPDVIIQSYLDEAVRQLGERKMGDDAGSVYHEFAVFCDNQLKDQGNVEDLKRLKRLRDAKKSEVDEWSRMIKDRERMLKDGKSAKDALIKSYGSNKRKSEAMLKLDHEEYRRLANSQQTLLTNSISNYLRCLAATNDFESDAVRFCALWLNSAGNEAVNTAASLVSSVPSWKFTMMVNQLSSRLSAVDDTFQPLLQDLVFRICKDHPYHALYQIHALKNSKTTDQAGNLRKQAAKAIWARLTADTTSMKTAQEIEDALNVFNNAACFNEKEKVRNLKAQKQKVQIGNFFPRDVADGLTKKIPRYRRPSPTSSVAVRADCDYSSTPYLDKFSPDISIAGGLSAPKILRALCSDGTIIRMLVKSGNDDLRQDSIMEQVFAQVSQLLQKSSVTRQRNLQVRTYNVIPLTERSGMIEFVPNTIPIHEYLIPAHEKYHPHEWKQKQCRETVQNAADKSREVRLKAYQSVCTHFTPCMRYWFMHNFNGPDEWFGARLRYTRSTAAISILGHVLGLGDRHGHNILLDESSGEVVHIDLGVAFEQGRVLPIPEVVPFRLTRDIVDGMGITKTEGVFRRCCEFTLSILRDNAEYITTILDVLRYDPLYQWSSSPVRLRRIQDKQAAKGVEDEDARASRAPSVAPTPSRSTRKSIQKEELVVEQQPVLPLELQQGDTEEAEAERALLVVAKKLSKTLSVSATVNELIVQAVDERNLAVLFAGWAAWC